MYYRDEAAIELILCVGQDSHSMQCEERIDIACLCMS